ncbi:Hypothetical protein RMHFA_04001 [Roseomonas mucosa]|nr:Hypothetical protein RMHFA_04001 [Roseomonas mucosa]
MFNAPAGFRFRDPCPPGQRVPWDHRRWFPLPPDRAGSDALRQAADAASADKVSFTSSGRPPDPPAPWDHATG